MVTKVIASRVAWATRSRSKGSRCCHRIEPAATAWRLVTTSSVAPISAIRSGQAATRPSATSLPSRCFVATSSAEAAETQSSFAVSSSDRRRLPVSAGCRHDGGGVR